ncbi:MAG: hypothetical protein JO134_10390 [Xanthobacteraceae bacterium]|nr:hypothetical protein [Xanthobacteraceae bacterium]
MKDVIAHHRARGTLSWIQHFPDMQSRAEEYRANAALCALHAAAVPDPMKQFYQALQLQWECLARQTEREADNADNVIATKTAA